MPGKGMLTLILINQVSYWGLIAMKDSVVVQIIPESRNIERLPSRFSSNNAKAYTPNPLQ
jgi:hypothetical protein